MSGCFVVLLAGPVTATPELRAMVAGCRTIAADRGMAHAAALGLRPELWVGDFDSADPALLTAHADVPRDGHARDKDRTDGEIAVEAAIARGADRLLLVGALRGPRTDHAFAHLVLGLRVLEETGLDVRCFDGEEWAVPLRRGETRLRVPAGAAFSILKFDDLAGLTIGNARWPLNEADLAFGSILTQSNEASGGEIVVRLRSGRAVLLARASADKD